MSVLFSFDARSKSRARYGPKSPSVVERIREAASTILAALFPGADELSVDEQARAADSGD